MKIKSINDLQRHTENLHDGLATAISKVIDSGWFVLGNEVKKFEEEFAEYCGGSHCVSLANGTDALEFALRALDIGPSSNVITVANAGTYSSIAILAVGATPVYAEINEHTLLVDTSNIEQILNSQRVDAIIVTHLYGSVADIDKVIELARRYDIPVVEDCAQAHGAIYNGKKVGTFGDIGCFSFYPTKNLGAIGDGGAIVTNNDNIAARVASLRQYGWERKYFVGLPGGRNSRLDEMQAAVLRFKLPFLDRWNTRRREIAAQYSEHLDNARIELRAIDFSESYVAHLYVIRTKEREKLKQYLTERGVPFDIHYPVPDYAQPAFKQLIPKFKLSITEQACNEALTLPCFPEMTNDEVHAIIGYVNSW